MVFSAEAFRANDRNGQVFSKPGVRGHALFFHRFFEPGEVEFLQLFADVQRFGAAVPVIAVDHQVDIRADRFTHSSAGFDVHFWVRCEGNRRHPGVQLDGFIAARDQFFSEAGVFVGRREAARQVVTAHGAAVRRHFIAEAAQQFPDRHIQFATN
ncbi:hypothetical protein D3C78_976370 [compost metagenome]